ncbi:MAG: transcription-repair coupling factor [Candidatus Hydrogenedentes bacterium]|nr:transcription-repair coupling factor [Candidatus Hydrogenedentota bacterium]
MSISVKEFEIIEKLSKALQKVSIIQVTGPWAFGKSILTYFLSKSLDKPTLIVAPDSQSAEEILEDFITLSSEESVYYFPPWETLPTDIIDPAEDIVSERLKLLTMVSEKDNFPPFTVTSIRSLLQAVPSWEVIKNNKLHLKQEDEIDFNKIAEKLIKAGYQREYCTMQPGEFSIRGGIIDIFSFGRDLPIRIELIGDLVGSIREFDPETQKSIAPVKEVDIILRPEKQLILDIKNDERKNFLDYFTEGTLLVLDEPLNILSEGEKIESEFEENPYTFSLNSIKEYLCRFKILEIAQISNPTKSSIPQFVIPMSSIQSYLGNLSLFWEDLKRWDLGKYQVRILCNTPAEQLRMAELVKEQGYELSKDPFDLKIECGKIRGGFVYPEEKIVIVSEKEIFGRKFIRRRHKLFRKGSKIYSFTELKPGDFVVHEVHGIGKFTGLTKIPGRQGDYLGIVYRNGDMLYVPVTQLDQVRKYFAGEGATPDLDKIGGKTWNKTKERVKESVKQFAQELLKLYAKRHLSKGFAFSPDTPWQLQIEEAFDYEETPDQARAIEDVKRDMESPIPMDRLICGDVGFGKTEVAIRASFKAVMDGKQVAVLAPTTVLVHQHWRTFKERMAGFPIRIEALSRLRSNREIKNVLEGLITGEVDIVIGTHRLFSKDVQFKDLGLLIIDEEQRFGVRHKEHLKKMREHIDVLTLTATPIPRTLQFCLSGIRDMSIINTAPNDRLPIHTCITTWSPEVIREAIERELRREGQVYYLHNRVQTIDFVANKLKQLVPRARIGIAHGQMPKSEMESVMMSFINREIDVLVCTTIIASGIDIPNVNTIIVDRADMFGLSELYQIRGRVGRYKHRAFAYLLVPVDKPITKEAQERLKAIQDISTLGAGLQIALKDLEIRGAGDLLGPEQSGHITAVGFDTYNELIKEAIAELKGEPLIKKKLPVFDANLDARIPEEYISDSLERMRWYHRISEVKTSEECNELRDEMRDRYGEIPLPTRILLNVMKARTLGTDLGVRRFVLRDNYLIIEFDTHYPLTTERKKLALYTFTQGTVNANYEVYPYLEIRGNLISSDLLDMLLKYLENLYQEGL